MGSGYYLIGVGFVVVVVVVSVVVFVGVINGICCLVLA